MFYIFFFFFSSRRRHTRSLCDWSSDVCSSDLGIWIRQEFTKTQRDLEEYLEGRATALSQRVEAEIQQEITVLQAIAALPSLDEPNLPEFHREAARMIAAMPRWAVIGLVDVETGKEVVNT